jgi:hypothetical protein
MLHHSQQSEDAFVILFAPKPLLFMYISHVQELVMVAHLLHGQSPRRLVEMDVVGSHVLCALFLMMCGVAR